MDIQCLVPGSAIWAATALVWVGFGRQTTLGIYYRPLLM